MNPVGTTCRFGVIALMSSVPLWADTPAVDRDLAYEQSRQKLVGQSIAANRGQLLALLRDVQSNGLADQWGEVELARLIETLDQIEGKPLAALVDELRAARRNLEDADPHIERAAGYADQIEAQLAAILKGVQAVEGKSQQHVDVASRTEARKELDEVASKQKKMREELAATDEPTFNQTQSHRRAEQEQLAGQVSSIQQQSSGESGEGSESTQQAGRQMAQAHSAMRDAARAMGEGEREKAIEAQKRAEQALGEAIKAMDQQIATDKQGTRERTGPEGSDQGEQPGQATNSQRDGEGKSTMASSNGNRNTGESAGKATHGAAGTDAARGGGSAEWQPLAADQRAAVFEAYVRDLPVEYRSLLEQYYEVLSE